MSRSRLSSESNCRNVLLRLVALASLLVITTPDNTGVTALKPSDRDYWYNQKDTKAKGQNYGVIFDCGSSGTRAQIYRWDADREYPELLNHIEPLRDTYEQPITMKKTPGLASFVDDPEQANEHIDLLIREYVLKQIPPNKHNTTFINILATAGMRLLSEEDQQTIMDSVHTFLTKKYNFSKIKTEVISGKQEGMYQWISLNAKSERFSCKEKSAGTRTYAVIEMGGASTQVTYAVDTGLSVVIESKLRDDKLINIYKSQLVVTPTARKDIKDHDYQLFSTTFLGLGSNSARGAYVDLLINKHRVANEERFSTKLKTIFKSKKLSKAMGKVKTSLFSCFGDGSSCSLSNKDSTLSEQIMTVADPCLPDGYLSQIMKKPKRLLEPKPGDPTIGLVIEDDEEDFEFELSGKSDYKQCKSLIEKMLHLAKEEQLNCKPDEACTMKLLGTDFMPFSRAPTIGIGDLYYTTHSVHLSGKYQSQRVLMAAKKTCALSNSELEEKYSNEPEDRRVLKCFKLIWVDTFLRLGLNMPTKGNFVVQTQNRVYEEPLDWTMGAVLAEAVANNPREEAASSNDYDSDDDSDTEDDENDRGSKYGRYQQNQAA